MSTVLIAHGFGSNANIAETIQTKNIHKALTENGYKVKYLQAPIKLKLEDFPFPPVHDITKNDLFSWWKFDSSSPRELYESVVTQAVKEVNEQGDTVVGIIGLSQGGSLTGIVSANYKRLIPSLKFAVTYSAFHYPAPNKDLYNDDVYDGKIDIPFLTIVGEADKVVLPDVSLQFQEKWVIGGDVYRHDGGHVFADDAASVDHLIQWVTQKLGSAVAVEA